MVLRSELGESRLFRSVVDRPVDADIIIEPRLETFLTAQMELEQGARSIGEVTIRVRAHGPVDERGRRALLLDEVYGDRQMTPPELRTMPRHFLAGNTLRQSMRRLLAGIDGSNVSRQGMPNLPLPVVESVAPADASSERAARQPEALPPEALLQR